MTTYRWSRILLAFVFLLVSSGKINANGGSDLPKEVIDLLKSSGPGSSVEVSQNIQNGLVTHTSVVITLCDQSGASCGTKRFRTTHSQVNVDGKTFFAETIDLGSVGNFSPKGPQTPLQEDYKRLSFRSKSEDFDLDINPYSPFYQEAAAVLPTVAVGVANAIQDMKAAARASERIQKAYQGVLQKLGGSFDQAVQNSADQQQAASANAGYISAYALERLLKSSQSSTPAKEYQDYLSAIQDPTRFVEYEVLPETREHLKSKTQQASRRGFARDAVHYAEILLNQKDQAQRLEAEKKLGSYFKDGLLQTEAFGSSQPSFLDQSGFATPANEHGGQVLRRLGNKAQIQWLESDGLMSMPRKEQAAYVSALLALRAADESFFAGEDAEGFELASAADALLDFSVGFAHGSTSTVLGAVKALPELGASLGRFFTLALNDEEAAVQQLYEFAENIPGMLGAVAAHYAQLGDTLMTGNAANRGEVLGEVTAEIFLGIVTNGASGSLAKLVRGESLLAGASARIAQSLAKVKSKVIGHTTQDIYKQVALKNPESAIRISRAVQKLEPQLVPAYQKMALQSAEVATTKSVMALTRAAESGVLRRAEQFKVAEKLMPYIEKAPHNLDFRLIGSSEKVALIGQDMAGNVLPVRDALNRLGLKVETFLLTADASDDWRKLVELFPDPQNIPKNLIRNSLGYIENKEWIQKLIDQGYTVLDANNPNNRSYSIYYGEIERGMLKKANSR